MPGDFFRSRKSVAEATEWSLDAGTFETKVVVQVVRKTEELEEVESRVAVDSGTAEVDHDKFAVAAVEDEIL